jgi:hypothetical protein
VTDEERTVHKTIIATYLAHFFKEEPYKIALWLLDENPMFGGTSPAQLIAIRGDAGLKKVSQFISVAKDESELES